MMTTFKLTTLALLTPLAFISCKKESADVVEVKPAAEAQPSVTPYPLDVCIVSGEKLGSMGESISITHEGQEIKLCCSSCKPKFKKDPEKFLKKLEGQTL